MIVVGELRDAESFAIALQAADTGHLVHTTVHSNITTSTIERVINIFPPNQQNIIRTRLADNLLFMFRAKTGPYEKGRWHGFRPMKNS